MDHYVEGMHTPRASSNVRTRGSSVRYVEKGQRSDIVEFALLKLFQEGGYRTRYRNDEGRRAKTQESRCASSINRGLAEMMNSAF